MSHFVLLLGILSQFSFSAPYWVDIVAHEDVKDAAGKITRSAKTSHIFQDTTPVGEGESLGSKSCTRVRRSFPRNAT